MKQDSFWDDIPEGVVLDGNNTSGKDVPCALPFDPGAFRHRIGCSVVSVP
jgi:hypothetical protein